MQLNVDVRQPIQWTASSAELSRPWILGLIAVDDRPLVKPSQRPYSYMSDCECPDSCLRDHENE